MKDGNLTILYKKETVPKYSSSRGSLVICVIWLTLDLRDPSRDLNGHVLEGRSRLSRRDPSSRPKCDQSELSISCASRAVLTRPVGTTL
jgi:hypothetical protein